MSLLGAVPTMYRQTRRLRPLRTRGFIAFLYSRFGGWQWLEKGLASHAGFFEVGRW